MNDLGYMGKYLRDYLPTYNANTFIHSFYEELRAFPPTAVIVQQKQIPDVSFYDGLIDWDLMRQHTDSVIIRAGQGNWIDEYFFTNWAEAKNHGLKRGLYWFYDGRYSPGAQAGLLASLIQDDPPELFAATDWERNYSGGFEGLANVVAFMQRVQVLLPDIRQKFYTGYYWFIANSNPNPTTNASQYNYLKSIGLWLAWYTNNPAIVLIPKPWVSLEFWQWGTPAWGAAWGSQKAEIDMSYYNGTEEQFQDMYGAAAEPPIGEPMDKYMKVTDVVTQSLNVRSSGINLGADNDLGDFNLLKGDIVHVVEINPANYVRLDALYRNGINMTLPSSPSGQYWALSKDSTAVYLVETTFTPPMPVTDNITVTITENGVTKQYSIDGKVNVQ